MASSTLFESIALLMPSIALLMSISINFIFRIMKRTTQLTACCDRSASHYSAVLVLTQLNDLITGEVLSFGPVLWSVALIKMVISEAINARSTILIRSPITIAKVISVARNPRVNTFGIDVSFWIPVRTLFIRTVESDCGSLSHLFAFCVILDNFPILLNRDINVSKLNLPFLFFLNLSQLLPLN